MGAAVVGGEAKFEYCRIADHTKCGIFVQSGGVVAESETEFHDTGPNNLLVSEI
jgi:hypothetical protein